MRKTTKNAGPAAQTASGAYAATPDLEERLLHEHEVTLEGGTYIARVTRSLPARYEAWTDSQPFVYGPGSSTLQGALDALHELVEERRASDEAAPAKRS